MQVYAVIGGINYGGEVFDTLRLFDCKSAAEVYAKEIKDVRGFDYVEVKVMDVCMKSALAV